MSRLKMAVAAIALLAGASPAIASPDASEERPAPPTADQGEALFQAVLANPDDPAANIAYARYAEAAGELRQAMAAYERVARADPTNTEASREFTRLRRLVSPPKTDVEVSVGGSYDADARRVDEPFSGTADGSFDVAVEVKDERTVGGQRLRTIAAGFGGLQARFEDLNTLRGGFWTGPVFALAPETSLHLAVGGALDWLFQRALYGEGSIRAELATIIDGAPQELTFTFGHRETLAADPGFDGSYFLDVTGLATKANVLMGGDAVYLQPGVRRSGGGALESGEAGAEYWEIGARLAYFRPVAEILTDAGFSVGLHHRTFDEEATSGDDAGDTRRDLRLEAGFHLQFRDFFDENMDLAADYYFERNVSNDDDDDYRNHVVSARMIWRF